MELILAISFSFLVLLSCFVVAIFGRKWNFNILMAISAGGLLSVVVLEFLPHSLSALEHAHHELELPIAPLLILLGIFTQALVEAYVIPRFRFLDKLINPEYKHSHSQAHHHSHLLTPASVCSVVACLSVCSFFDGIRFFASLHISQSAALITGLALFLHLVSEGALVAVIGLASKIKIRAILFLSFFISGSFILGSLFSYFFAKHTESKNLVAFAAGVLLYVCFIHLVPFSLKNKHKHWLFAGVIIFSALNLLTHS